MDINLVLHQGESWILGKFANKMQEHLEKQGCTVKVSKEPDNSMLVNHHFIYYDYYKYNRKGIDTLMITHVDEWDKWKQLRRNLKDADAGICMSSDTLKKMRWAGLPMSKLLYINPAHDAIVQTPKIRIGFFSNVQLDGRKREYMIPKALKTINPAPFHFIFMGVGWEKTCRDLDELGICYTLYNQFDYNAYVNEMSRVDYLLYTGKDEGSMSFLDAIMFNKKTIVTRQGFHCDISRGINFGFDTINQLASIFKKIETEYIERQKDIDLLTWENYSIKHLEVWDYLIHKKSSKKIINGKSQFKDGVNSIRRNSSIKLFLVDDFLFYKQKYMIWYYLFKSFVIRYGFRVAFKKALNRINRFS